MRTIEIKLYKFDELSEEAKERVREMVFQDVWEYYENDIYNSLKAIADEINFDVYIDSYDNVRLRDTQKCSSYDFSRNAEYFDTRRTIAYLENKYEFKTLDYFVRLKFVGKKLSAENMVFAKKRYDFGYKFTGYCYDEILDNAYKMFLKCARKNKNLSLHDFAKCLLTCYKHEVKSEYNGIKSDDYVSDNVSEKEFYVNGDLYEGDL